MPIFVSGSQLMMRPSMNSGIAMPLPMFATGTRFARMRMGL